jgi:hypothetical protein
MVRPITININEGLAKAPTEGKGAAGAESAAVGGAASGGKSAASAAASMFSGAAASLFSVGHLQQQQTHEHQEKASTTANKDGKAEPYQPAPSAHQKALPINTKGRHVSGGGPNVYPEVWEALKFESVSVQDGKTEEKDATEEAAEELRLPELVERLGATQQQVLEQWQQTQKQLVGKQQEHEKEWTRAEENVVKAVQLQELLLQEKGACKQLEKRLQKSMASEDQTAGQAKVNFVSMLLHYCPFT